MIGGMVGFACGDGIASVDNFTLKSWNTSNSSFDIVEHVDLFDIDGNGRSANDPAYDLAGNMTFDGTQKFTFDAWNRLVKVAHAYRDGSNNVQSGAASVTMTYDGKGRRVKKAITNTGQWDATFKYYYDRDLLIETRNGSDGLVKQHVWGTRYIDELVQISIPTDPEDDEEFVHYWACQDANYNVIGVVDSSGVLKERYEYKPYGERSVFSRSGANDTGAYAPTQASARFSAYGTTYPQGICEVGHQGLVHDEEAGLVYNRARALHPGLGRFVQRDPLGYRAGTNLARYEGNGPVSRLDPMGLIDIVNVQNCCVPWVSPVTNGVRWQYGCYCGFGAAPGAQKPTDELDKCCKTHDNCYAAAGPAMTPAQKDVCDDDLCDCALEAEAVGCATAPDPHVCRLAAAQTAAFFCDGGD